MWLAQNACGLEMGGRKLFFHTFTNDRAVKAQQSSFNSEQARIGNSLVIVTTGNKTIKENIKRRRVTGRRRWSPQAGRPDAPRRDAPRRDFW